MLRILVPRSIILTSFKNLVFLIINYRATLKLRENFSAGEEFGEIQPPESPPPRGDLELMAVADLARSYTLGTKVVQLPWETTRRRFP